MKNVITSFVFAAMLAAVSSLHAVVAVGQSAPDFTATDASGKTVSLSDYKGKVVVLEWTNPQCPFVKKFYGSGTMQNLQKTYTDKGIVWLSIDSSAPGKEGSCTPAEATELLSKEKAAPTALLLDANGNIGHLYGATNTPQMFVIAKDGNVVYSGAIDSIKSADPKDIPAAKNYVSDALNEVLAGKPVSHTSATPYGCGVHY